MTHIDGNPGVRSTSEPGWFLEVEALYRAVDSEIDPHQNLCRLRGHCCDFRNAPHVLYTTRVEVEYALKLRADPWQPQGPLCPFWRGGLCTARSERPLGCRTYFCDPSWIERGAAIHEKYHALLAAIEKRHGIAYRYQPWVKSLVEAFTRDEDVAEPRPLDEE